MAVALACLLVVAGYLVGSIPFAIVVGKWLWHVDVRLHGSGNVGTTNVFRVLGRKAGTLVLVGDMGKGFLPVAVAILVFPGWAAWYPVIVGLAALLGHMYSVFLRGAGGKGVATGAGVILALMPEVFVISLAAFLVVLFVSRIVSLASIVAALTFACATVALGKPLPYMVLGVLATAVVIYAHRANIRRIALRCENRVTFPWEHRSSGSPPAAGDRPSIGAS